MPVISVVRGFLKLNFSYFPALVFFGCGVLVGAAMVVKESAPARSTQRFSCWSQEIAFFHAAHFFCADVLRGKRLKSDTGCHDWEEQEVENGSSHGISVDVLNTGAVYDDLIKIIPFRPDVGAGVCPLLETTESCLLSPGGPPLVLLLLVLAGGE